MTKLLVIQTYIQEEKSIYELDGLSELLAAGWIITQSSTITANLVRPEYPSHYVTTVVLELID